ncbi:unnamed protein product [Effrenium voratum]|nr:unnamed protein product [Effrenium voratum]CAJ1436221.1 unnamed protein product [Effrenium voratum]
MMAVREVKWMRSFSMEKAWLRRKCGSSSIETWDAEEVPKRFSELQRINFPEPWASAHCCVASDGQCFGVGFASNKKSRIRVANVALALHSALIRKQEQRWSISTGSNEVLRALYALAGDRLKAPKVIARWKEVHTPASSTTASQCAESASSGQQRESCAQRVSCAQREPSAQRERASPCDDSRPLRAMRSAHHARAGAFSNDWADVDKVFLQHVHEYVCCVVKQTLLFVM